MPIYEYRCAACGHELETLQKLSDSPLTACPACGQERLNKLVSAAGFRLKGSGWYATDFKNASKPAAKADGGNGKSAAASAAAEDASVKPASGEAKRKPKRRRKWRRKPAHGERRFVRLIAPRSCGPRKQARSSRAP